MLAFVKLASHAVKLESMILSPKSSAPRLRGYRKYQMLRILVFIGKTDGILQLTSGLRFTDISSRLLRLVS